MIEVALNDVSDDGMRGVRIVSDQAIDPCAQPSGVPVSANVCTWGDDLLGLHYAEWTWPCMGFVDVHFEGVEKFRRLVMWKFLPGERVSDVIRFVAEWYFQQTHHRPEFAWMQKLPAGAEYGVEVDGCMLLEAEWVLPGCVMVGG